MNKAHLLLFIIIFAFCSVSAQKVETNKSPVGKWLFEAPYAPEGFTAGTIDVALAEKEYKAIMVFTGNGYSLAGEKVRFRNDSLLFNIFMEGEDIAIKLKFDGEKKMSGLATYSEGDIPLFLSRDVKQE